MENRIREILGKGKRDGIYPGAVLLVAQKGEVLIHEATGHLSLIPETVPMKRDTIFDLASLTKPLATTLALMKLVDQGRLGLDRPLAEILKDFSLKGERGLTPRMILCHCGGFADWRPFYKDLEGFRPENRKGALRRLIMEGPLAYKPGKGSLYSDLGFMILEWLIEEAAGVSMASFVGEVFYRPLLLNRTFLFTESSELFHKGLFAATEDCPWRNRIIQGEVHDENAFAVGGYSGHAGLFGTAEEVYRIVNLLTEHHKGQRDDYLRPETVRAFFRRQDIVDGCTWALGWDTPSLEGSSAGSYFSQNSVGHLGFTGTSLWMDLDRDIVVVFLSNRVHPTRENEKIKVFRPLLHDTIMEELGKNI